MIGRGLFAGNPVDFTNGVIADARTYDRPLAPAEVQRLYKQGPSQSWNLDRSEGAAPEVSDRKHWNLVGGVDWLPDQKGGSLSLDGKDGCADPGLSLLDTSRSYTVSAWVRLTRLDGHQTFISQDGASVSGFYLKKNLEDNHFAFAFRTADSVDAPSVAVTSNAAAQTDTVYHIVGVFERTPPLPAEPEMVWDTRHQGQFLESLTHDLHGDTWAATEGHGVWRFDPHAPASRQWTQFTRKDGLGDDFAYALACDRQGRLWAGSLNHGVSVFDGKQWRTYGQRDGLLGSRVFGIATCPTDGDVWIATEAGLTRYSLKLDSWHSYSRLDGLPSDAVQCLAFDKGGTLFVGTQADGVAVSSPSDNYKTWRVVSGPAKLPESPGGPGLPTGMINCLLAASDGVVYAGTTSGLARSGDGGKNWRHVRGADWAEKAGGHGGSGWLDPGLVDNADLRALEVLPLDDAGGKPVRIAAGGPGGGGWAADTAFQGGSVFHSIEPVDVRAIPNPAPESVYQSGRWGSFTYTVSHLHPGHEYAVRLHLAEVAFDRPGQRVFNVSLNGERVLVHFDIFAEAGAKNKAIVKVFSALADERGCLTVAFRGTQPLPVSDAHVPQELAEDYVTCLAEDGVGHLLVGHRQKGLEIVSFQNGQRQPLSTGTPLPDFITSLLPSNDDAVVLAGYGSGLTQVALGNSSAGQTSLLAASASCPSLPQPAAPPTLAELNDLLRQVCAVRPDKAELTPHAVALPDDWLTEGDWLGRYGRYWACDPACSSPDDYYWGAGWQSVDYAAAVGPGRTGDDTLRYWVQTLYTTEPHCLEMPPTYLDSRIQKKLTTQDKNRRDCSQDDHGETYPMALDGPNIYQTLSVPSGLYVLSLYFFNRQSPVGGTSDRDYRLSVRPQPDGVGVDNLDSFPTLPEWAHGRVLQYYPGVWKRFLVRGPQSLAVEVNRNHSWNTELDGAMLDLVDETPPPYFGTVKQWEEGQSHQEEQRQQALSRDCITVYAPAVTEREAADRLLDILDAAQTLNSSWWGADSRRFYAPLLRWYTQAAARGAKEAQVGLDKRLATCCYQMGQYQQWEEVQKRIGLTPARDVEKALRWDGISDGGQGYDVVQDYLTNFTAGKQSLVKKE
jgi:hypothetical protein